MSPDRARLGPVTMVLVGEGFSAAGIALLLIPEILGRERLLGGRLLSRLVRKRWGGDGADKAERDESGDDGSCHDLVSSECEQRRSLFAPPRPAQCCADGEEYCRMHFSW